MNTYLRLFNPAIAVIVFLLCLYSGATDSGEFEFTSIADGSLSTYFFAKGIFCGVAIFLLGKILEALRGMRAVT